MKHWIDYYKTHRCIICKNKLIYPQTKYCSKRCSSKGNYINNKIKIISNTRSYEKRNPKKVKRWHKKAMKKHIKTYKFRKSMKREYQKNKKKWSSRTVTRNFIKKNINLLIKKCKSCYSKKNLQIHHEIYPVKVKEIKKAIIENKIYYLCKKCHGKLRKKINYL